MMKRSRLPMTDPAQIHFNKGAFRRVGALRFHLAFYDRSRYRMRSSDSGVRGHCFAVFLSPGSRDDERVVAGKAEKAATALPLALPAMLRK